MNFLMKFMTLLDLSLSLVELDENESVGDVDEDVHEHAQENKSEDPVDRDSMTKDALNITIELVGENEADCVDGGKQPTQRESQDDSGVGHDTVVLQGGCDVEEPGEDDEYFTKIFNNEPV